MAYMKFDVYQDLGEYWQITPFPASGDPLDVHCCDNPHFPVKLICEVIQYGLEWDKHIYFMACPVCTLQYVTQCEMKFSSED